MGIGRRRGRGARVSSSLAEINVVPLVDVMLVLLVIFMVTAPMMQQGLQVNLPQARRAAPARFHSRDGHGAGRLPSYPHRPDRR